MKVGVMLPVGDLDGPDGRAPTWAEVRRVAETAEAVGLDSVWMADHLLARVEGAEHGMHDAWTLLTAVAAVTERVELGPLVLCSGFRSPGVIASMAATLDAVSGGRLVLGLGAGWHDPEYEAFGFPTDHKVGRFEEALEIVARLLRGERLTYDGRYYRVTDAVLAPPPERRIPVLVAAHRPRMLGLAARFADVWNTAWFESTDDERLGERLRWLEAALAEEGRDPGSLERTVGIAVREGTDLPLLLSGLQELGVAHAIAHLDPATPESVRQLGLAVARFRGAA